MSNDVESKRDHSDCDCFVIFILSHESNGSKYFCTLSERNVCLKFLLFSEIYATDGEFDINTAVKRFTGSNCKSLVGKPKLFFIQTYREDSGDLVHDAPAVKPSPFLIPNYADFLIFHNTFSGKFFFENSF